MQTLIKIVVFIIITTVGAEYLVNRQSSKVLFLLFIVIEIVSIYFLLYKPIKSLFK